MKIFRKTTQEVVKHEQVKQSEQSHGQSESIPVFKERGRKTERTPDIRSKGKDISTPKHR